MKKNGKTYTKADVKEIDDADAGERAVSWWNHAPSIITGSGTFLAAMTGFLTIVLPLMMPAPKADPAITSYANMTSFPTAAQNTPEFSYRQDGRQDGRDRPWRRGPANAIVTADSQVLRSGPSEKTSEVAKLPKDSTVVISRASCHDPVYIEPVEGRWCRAMYTDAQGKVFRGWAFDAYLHIERRGSSTEGDGRGDDKNLSRN